MLNWGLGHATRCIPVIRALEREGYAPVLASDGEALTLLRDEFPHLRWEDLPAYGIRYAKNRSALLSVILRTPLLWLAARREHRVLHKLVKKYQPSGIISDNRLGFYHRRVPSVYLTHQLKLMLPFARKLASSWHHRFIRRYDQCWIPDIKGADGLAGEMTLNIDPGVSVRYLGPLSRFRHLKPDHSEKRYHTCAVLSGPEPQRTLLEEIIYNQLKGMAGRHILVRGTRNKTRKLPEKEGIEVIDFLTGSALAQKIQQAEIVISRSGYSSLMDYWFLGNRALLIPTPGQPEQEYLARYMLSKGWFFYCSQDYLSLARDIPQAMLYGGFKNHAEESGIYDMSELLNLFEGKGEGGT